MGGAAMEEDSRKKGVQSMELRRLLFLRDLSHGDAQTVTLIFAEIVSKSMGSPKFWSKVWEGPRNI